ncbi:MAG: ABC transporter permease subunit [Oscillospiraceae bacterium]|nr:ABC transporter permease subunit [Oscillospiraceae bacterium]
MAHNRQRLGRALAVLLALLVWQAAAMWVDQRILLVSPIDVIKRLATIWQEQGFWSTIWFSFYHIAGGFLIALTLGVLLASLSGRFPWIETLLWPFMVTVKTVPVASFVVICLIWLSAKNLSVFISFLIVLPVVYGNVLQGVKSTDRGMLEVAQVFRMPLIRRISYVHLPQLKPFILSACSTALGMAWKAGVAAEIIGIPDGSMGKQLFYAKVYLDTDDLLCWTVVIVLVSVLFEKLFMKLIKYAYGRLERG